MVILLPFLTLEGQSSYSIEDRPWLPHNSLVRMEGNDHGHTSSLLEIRRADLLFPRGYVIATSQLSTDKWKEVSMVILSLSLLKTRRADLLFYIG